jgi:leader peptidase (prepilin peptidase)/N-methyltransferase
VKYALFSVLLIALSFTGLEQLILPDVLTLGGTLLGIAISWSVPPDGTQGNGAVGVTHSVAGALIPSVALYLLGFLYYKVRGVQGLGFGDVKMVAMIGAFLGLGGAALATMIGLVLAIGFGFTFLRLARRNPAAFEVPTGPFWSIAALTCATISPLMWLWTGMNVWWTWLIGHF